MFTVRASVEIAVRPEQAFAWISDLSNLPKWQSGVFRSEVLTAPPVRVGTRFRETFRVMGIPMTAACEVIDLRAPKSLGFSAKGGQMNYETRFTFAPSPTGTRVSSEASVSMRGLWRLIEPLVRAESGREIEAEYRRLKAAIEVDVGSRSRAHSGSGPLNPPS